VRYTVQRLRWAIVALILASALMGADHLGLFGHRPEAATGDYERYHDREFRVVHVVDGDTLDVDAPDRDKPSTRVRLWGVDTPETRHPAKSVQHYGREATDFTRTACDQQTVRLGLVAGKTRDRYGRLLAYVTLPDGRMLNRELVRLGYGYADPRYRHPHQEQFELLQAEALAARRGLWQDVRNADLPYYYRDELVLQPRPAD